MPVIDAAVLGLYRRMQAHPWMEDLVEHVQITLEEAGVAEHVQIALEQRAEAPDVRFGDVGPVELFGAECWPSAV